jgi:acyl carrier protein
LELTEVLKQVNDVFKDVFDDDSLAINSETTAKDVDDWDSLTHIQLVVAIEKHFKIRFTSSEIQGFANVGQMCEAILTKVNKS